MQQQMMNQPMPTTVGDVNQVLPDETRYIMPPDAMRMQENRWVYGDPEMDQSGMMQDGMMQGGDMQMQMMPMPGQGMGNMSPGSRVSSQQAQSQRMKNPVDMAATHSPSNSSQAYQASLRSLLARNVGYFVVCTFQIGNQQAVTWQGILHTVGSDYLVLYQPDHEKYISCDFYALKFVQFHDTKNVPYCASAQAWVGRREM